MSFDFDRLSVVYKWLRQGEFYGQHNGPITIRIWRSSRLFFRISDQESGKTIQIAVAPYEEGNLRGMLTRALERIVENVTV
jgi:hypothetical protein